MITNAIVAVCAMLSFVGIIAIVSRHIIQQKDNDSRVEVDKLRYAPKPEKPEPIKSADGNDIIHIADHYAIGNEFTMTGPNKRLQKYGLIVGKPTRDTLEVKWLPVDPDTSVVMQKTVAPEQQEASNG